MGGTRIEPDGYDVVVWKFDEAGAPFVNSSTVPLPSSNLTSQSGTAFFQQPSPFAASGTNSCIQFIGNNSNSPRNIISGANTVNQQPPVTFSCWLYIRTYTFTGFTQHFWSKQHTTNVWSGTFAQVGMQNRTFASQPTAFDLFAVTTTGGDVNLDSNNNVPLNTWVHVGLVYNGTTKTGYLNGNVVGTAAATGNINYGNSGPWFFGAVPGAGNPEEGQYGICDFRIANVARDQAYFQNIYRNGVGTSAGGQPFYVYYKLRAYDLNCSTPTPVYWISNTVNYIDAPEIIPCGNLGPIEIVEVWPQLGFQEPVGTVQDALNGLTWLLPNTGNINSTTCNTVASAVVSVTLPGSESTLNTVTLRFKGVVEQKTYLGGSNDGAFFQTGGAPAVDNYNVYKLEISNPAQVFYLNRGASGLTAPNLIDYQKTIQMNGGAIVTLTAESIDNREIRNDGANAPISVTGVTNPAQPYNGQFIQMGVVSVT